MDNDEFLLLLQAQLDEAKSKGLINADIEALQKKIDTLKLKAEIDSKTLIDLVKQIENVIGKKISINIDTNVDTSVVKQIKKLSDDSANTVVQNEKKKQQAIKETNNIVYQSAKNSEVLDTFSRSLENIGMSSDEIKKVAGDIDSLGVKIKSLDQSQNNDGLLTVHVAGIDEYGQAVKMTRQYEVENGNLVRSIDAVSSAQEKAGVNAKTFAEQQDKAIAKAQKALAQFNNKSGGAFINSAEYKEVQRIIDGLGNTHSIEDLDNALNNLETTYNNMVSKLRNGKSLNPFINAKNEMATMDETIRGISLEFDKLTNKPQEVATEIKRLSEQQSAVNSYTVGTLEWADAYGELQRMIQKTTAEINVLKKAESSKSVQPKIDKIQLSLDNGDYDKKLAMLQSSYEKLGLSSTEIASKTNEVAAALDKLKAKNLDTLIQDETEFNNALSKAKNEAATLRADLDKIYNPRKQTKLSTDIQNWLNKNTRASKEAKDSLNAYYAELNNGRVSVSRLQYIETELKKIDAEQRGLGKLGKNLKDQLVQAKDSFIQWMSVSSLVMAFVYQLKRIPEEVKEVNAAMVELRKVSDASSQSITDYFDEAADSAKRLGSSVSDMINATADWSRLGYSLPDAKQLAEVATLYKNVGDNIDIDAANKSLISTLQGFQLEAEDALSIIDKFNEVICSLPSYIEMLNKNRMQLNLFTTLKLLGSPKAHLPLWC